MNKLTLSAIIASTLFITACDQAQETTEGAMDKATEMTHSAAEHAGDAAEAGKDMASDAMDEAKAMATDAMDEAKAMAADVADQPKEKMDDFMGSGFHDAATGHPVGTQSDIDALTAQYHEQQKAQ
jgi:ElaB/YqjD/DUF883 family membrane-anchored ribosome-binding protein